MLFDAIADRSGLCRAEYLKMLVEEAIQKDLSRKWTDL